MQKSTFLYQMEKKLQILIGEVYGNAFIDYSSFKQNQLSYGYELLWEMGAGNWLQFVPRLGIAISEENFKPYLGLKTLF